MTALKPPDFITVSDYLAGEELSDTKHEYLGGTVHAMAGATIRHNNIALNSLGSLYGKLRGKPCQPFNSDTKVRIEFPDHTRFYYPDAMVVSNQIQIPIISRINPSSSLRCSVTPPAVPTSARNATLT